MTFTDYIAMKYGVTEEDFKKIFQLSTQEKIKHLWEKDFKHVQY